MGFRKYFCQRSIYRANEKRENNTDISVIKRAQSIQMEILWFICKSRHECVDIQEQHCTKIIISYKRQQLFFLELHGEWGSCHFLLIQSVDFLALCNSEVWFPVSHHPWVGNKQRYIILILFTWFEVLHGEVSIHIWFAVTPCVYVLAR